MERLETSRLKSAFLAAATNPEAVAASAKAVTELTNSDPTIGSAIFEHFNDPQAFLTGIAFGLSIAICDKQKQRPCAA